MSDHHRSVVYHLAQPGQLPPGRIAYADERDGAIADVYLHPLHARNPLCRDVNWHHRQLIGYGLWDQRWTNDGRTHAPGPGLGIAIAAWRIVPAHEMPDDCYAFPIEEDGICIWLIRAGYCTAALRDEMNWLLDRVASDGLWLQAWYEHQDPPAAAPRRPQATPPSLLARV